MYYTEKQIKEIFEPWPLKISKGKYAVEPRTPAWVARNYRCWWDDMPHFDTAVRRVMGYDWENKRHTILGMSKYELPRYIVVGKWGDKKVVFDGNHRMITWRYINDNRHIQVIRRIRGS